MSETSTIEWEIHGNSDIGKPRKSDFEIDQLFQYPTHFFKVNLPIMEVGGPSHVR